MEAKDFIRSASELGEPEDKWMSKAENFARRWKQLDNMFGTIAGMFTEDDFTEDEYLWIFDKNTRSGIPTRIWFSIWVELGMTGAFDVIIDRTIVDIGEDMYIAYRNGAFDVPGQDLTRSVAMFLAGMENEALKHSIDPNGYVCRAYQQTGMPDMFWTTGTKED